MQKLHVVREGMVEAASDVEGHAILKRVFRCGESSRRGQPKRLVPAPASKEFHLHFFAGRECPSLQLLHVLRSVNQQNS